MKTQLKIERTTTDKVATDITANQIVEILKGVIPKGVRHVRLDWAYASDNDILVGLGTEDLKLTLIRVTWETEASETFGVTIETGEVDEQG